MRQRFPRRLLLHLLVNGIILLILLYKTLPPKSEAAYTHPQRNDVINFVLLHLGPTSPPAYLKHCVKQLRLSNPISDQVDVYLIAETQCISAKLKSILNENNVYIIDVTSLKSFRATYFGQTIRSFEQHLRAINSDPLWVYSSLRFKYLQALAHHRSLENIFTIEMDNLVYLHARRYINVLKASYPGIGFTRDALHRGIAGMTWFNNKKALDEFNTYFTSKVQAHKNDMHHIADYYTSKRTPDAIDTFPVIQDTYAKALKSKNGETVESSEDINSFSNNFHKLGLSIFDAAALGQYITGTDYPRGVDTRGFVNEAAVYQCDGIMDTYLWLNTTYRDKSYWTLHVEKQGHRYNVNNLHVHKKNLDFWMTQPANASQY